MQFSLYLVPQDFMRITTYVLHTNLCEHLKNAIFFFKIFTVIVICQKNCLFQCALNISQYRYQSDISTLQIIHTHLLYCNVGC